MDEKEKNINYNDPDIKTLRTYTSDMAEAIRTDEASVIKIALAEKTKREKEELYKKQDGTPITKTLLVLGGFLLILGSLFGVYFVIKKTKEKNVAPVIVQKDYSLISFGKEISIDVTDISKKDLEKTILNEVENQEEVLEIKKIKLITKNQEGENINLPVADFFRKLESMAPGRLYRSLTENYMIGSYNKHLFFLFESNDYSQSFTGLLEWEKNFLSDMSSLFKIDLSSTNQILLSQPLYDTVIANTDTRAVRDQINKDILYYTIVNKNKIIIAGNADTIKEIINRLLIKK